MAMKQDFEDSDVLSDQNEHCSLSLNLTIFQDPTCAWCCVGIRELQTAVRTLEEQLPGLEVTIVFKPYVIDPTLPEDDPSPKAITREERFMRRLGVSKWASIKKCLTERGARCGINFKFGAPARNPILPNRLVMRACEVGGGKAQADLLAELNHHIFELEEDPACLGVLSRCAAEAGLMCREQAIAFLTSRKLHDEVDQEVIAARTRGITGVPYVVVNDKYGICGGLPAESYVETFGKVLRHDFQEHPCS